MKASGVEPEAEIIGGELAGISSDPTQKLIGRKNDFQTTPRRWLVLLTFCGLGLGQAFTWNIFSPIEKQLKTTFDWTEDEIKWAPNVANISFLFALFPTAWAIPRFGPRKVSIFAAASTFLCAALRCIPLPGDKQAFFAVVLFSMVMNGLSGCWMNFGGPIISELWFPASERTLATSIGSVCSYAGSALGFIIGPLIVGKVNDTSDGMLKCKRLFYAEAVYTLVVFVAVLLHFPDRPEYPPSAAAAIRRQLSSREKGAVNQGGGSISALFCRAGSSGPQNQGDGQLQKFWVLTISSGLALGVYQGWGAALNLCLSSIQGFQDDGSQASWLGCVMTLSGCVGSVMVGFVSDRCFQGHLKLVACVLLVLSGACFVVFTLNAQYWQLPSLTYASGIGGGFFFNSSIPLFFELVMEITFGLADESASSMLMVSANTLVQIAFLAIPLKINGSALWMSWMNAISLFVAAFLILIIRVNYNRALSSKTFEQSGSSEHKIASNTAAMVTPTKAEASAFDRCGLL